MDSIKFLRGFQQVRVNQYLQNKSWKHFKSIHIYLEKPEEILIQKTTISESGLSEQSLYENYNLSMFCLQLHQLQQLAILIYWKVL